MKVKLLLIFVLFCSVVFGSGVELDLIRKNSIIPTINIQLSKNPKSIISLSKKIKFLVEKDLTVSCHFEVDKQNYNYSENDFKYNIKHNLVAFIFVNKTNRGYVSTLKLFDTNKKNFIVKKFITTNKNRYPFIAHQISIEINNYIKAPSIDWMNRFVIFARYTKAKHSEIVVADYTLTYQKVVVRNGLNIFPKWANKEQNSFYYTTYNTLKPTLVKQNLYTGKKEYLLSSDGMIVCSDVSKDGKKILVTMAPNTQPDIYLYNTVTKLKKRLTRYKGIDVNGQFVDDDTKVAFVSDRLGNPNIFIKSIGSGVSHRLVYHGKNNSQITTYKDLIVYSSRESDNEFGNNIFNLYIISTQSEYIRRLTTLGRNQYPKFSQDGESILYIKYAKNRSYLGIIRYKFNKSFLFNLRSGELQSIDW